METGSGGISGQGEMLQGGGLGQGCFSRGGYLRPQIDLGRVSRFFSLVSGGVCVAYRRCGC